MTKGRSPSAIRAATASASTCPSAARCSKSARAAFFAKARRWRCFPSARGCRTACSRPRSCRRRPVDHRRRRAFRQTARRGSGPPAGARARGAGHGGGGRHRRLRRAMCCISWPMRACSRAASRCVRWCCPMPSPTTPSPRRCMPTRGWTAPASSRTVFAALGGRATHAATRLTVNANSVPLTLCLRCRLAVCLPCLLAVS